MVGVMLARVSHIKEILILVNVPQASRITGDRSNRAHDANGKFVWELRGDLVIGVCVACSYGCCSVVARMQNTNGC